MCVRISTPANIYEPTITPKNQPAQKANTQIETPVKEQPIKDSTTIPKEGKVSAAGIDFVDPKENEIKAIPLKVKDNGELSLTEGKPAKFLVDENGTPKMDENGAFLIDEQKGQFAYVKVNDKGEAIANDKGEVEFVKIDSAAPSKGKAEEVSKAQETTKVEPKDGKTEEEFDIAPILDDKGETGKFSVDKKGNPLFDKEGALIPDAKGEPVYVKVKKGATDENGNLIPIVDDKGSLSYMSQTQITNAQTPPEVKKITEALDSHSAQRALTGLGYKSMAEGLVKKVSNTLIKGVSVGIPFTKTSIGFGTEQAVRTAVTKQLSNLSSGVVKVGGDLAFSEAVKNGVNITKNNVIKDLTAQGRLGKGVETLSMKEATKFVHKESKLVLALDKRGYFYGKEVVQESSGRVKAISSSYKTLKADISALKAGEKVSLATMAGVSKEIMVGAGEKALRDGTTQAIEKGVAKAIRKSDKVLAGTLVNETADNLVRLSSNAAAKNVLNSSKAVKVGTAVAKYGSVVSHVANGAILAYDAVDAYKKIKDPNVSGTSKALAGGTVALDVATMVLQKKYAGLSYVTTGLGIATSVGSDITKDKK